MLVPRPVELPIMGRWNVMRTTQRSCSACTSAVAPEDLFCGECGAPIAAEKSVKEVATGESGFTGAPVALAAAVRVRPGPRRFETSGILVADSATLAFFSKDASATYSASLDQIAHCNLTPIGPVDALQLSAGGVSECFLLRGGADFFEALREMLAREPHSEPTLRLRALSRSFAERAPQIVEETFSISGLLESPAAAQSFFRLVDLLVPPTP
jgi:hypothetical protein